jgi:hypothetical protein
MLERAYARGFLNRRHTDPNRVYEIGCPPIEKFQAWTKDVETFLPTLAFHLTKGFLELHRPFIYLLPMPNPKHRAQFPPDLENPPLVPLIHALKQASE